MRQTWKGWHTWLAASLLLHVLLLLFLAWTALWPRGSPATESLTLHWRQTEASPPAGQPLVETWHPPAQAPPAPAPPAPTPSDRAGTGDRPAAAPDAPPPMPRAWAEALAFQGRPPSFFGKGFGGSRIVFVIDISGSMLQKSGTGTRLAEAHQGLMRAVAGLQPSQEFNILFFADRTDAFLPAPVRADPEALRRAFTYIGSGVDCGGSTNLQDALRAALAMAPDTILLLSDGEANTEDEAILAEVRHLRARHSPRLTLHAIGFYLESGGRADRFLRRLASEHRGTYASWNPRLDPEPR